MKYDYSTYGAFKSATSLRPGANIIRAARRLGLRNRYLRFLSHVRRDKKVVEVGCGDGSFLRTMMEAGFSDVIGVEPSESYSAVVDRALIVTGFAEEYLTRCQSDSLAAIVALDVFEHVERTKLRELIILCHSRLISGGSIVFRIPNMASPLALLNFYGDLSHVCPMNQNSVSQILFGTGFKNVSFHPEPFCYPRSIASAVGILLWPFTKAVMASALAAFGVRKTILTPNLVCVVVKD